MLYSVSGWNRLFWPIRIGEPSSACHIIHIHYESIRAFIIPERTQKRIDLNKNTV